MAEGADQGSLGDVNRLVILLVDDDPLAIRTMEMILSDPDYRLVVAMSGPDALELVPVVKPDLILLDVMMPGMDGVEVCRAIRDNVKIAEVPILIVTTLDDRDSRLRALEAGADDFLTKPVDRVEIRTRVRTIARLNRARKYRGAFEQASRALAAAEEYSRRLALLRQIDRSILSAGSSAEIAGGALRGLKGMVPCRFACVTVLDPEGGCAQLLAGEGIDGEPGGDARPMAGIERLREGRPYIAGEPGGGSGAEEGVDMPPFLPAGAVRSLLRAPLMHRGRPIGVLDLADDRPGAFGADHVTIVAEVADSLALTLRHAWLLEQVRAGRERQERLTRKLIQSGESERRRIARELHDGIGQALAALKLGLRAILRGGASSPPSAKLEECLGIVEATAAQVREIALDLRPSILDDLGLVAALGWYVRNHAGRGEAELLFDADPPVIRAAPEVETACFRLTQEAVTNALKHAGAGRIRIELGRVGDEVRLKVEDDGKGFDPAVALTQALGGESLGLLGMRERVALLGGRFELSSRPGRGTVIRAALPLQPELIEDEA